MAVNVLKAIAPQTNQTIKLGIPGILAIPLLLLLAIGAFFGGWELTHPAADGSALGMPLAYLEHSPFTSYFIPGIILFVVFGVGSIVAVVATVLRHWSAPYLLFALGVGQMIWITVELAMVQVYHPQMHPLLFGWGAVAALLAYVWHRQNQRQG
jgi:hypothetical protein